MRFGGTILSLLLLVAAVLLPSVAFAHENRPQSVVVAAGESHAEVAIVAVDGCSNMGCDDSCPQHGTKGAPCSSSACCVGHCVGALCIDRPMGPLLSASAIAVRPASDQVLTSSASAPPFRPPRA